MFHFSVHYQLAQSRLADLNGIASAPSPRAGATGARNRATAASRQGASTSRFVQHYVEMVVVMFLGMFVLMAPAGWLFGAFGTSWSRLSPAMNMLVMALTMTVPMVGWMRYRGHAWRANLEMAVSMLVPTFAVMALLSVGVGSRGALTVPEHVAMLSCMLLVMLLRRDEYSCATHHQRHPAVAA